jgi:peptide/nickel transport system substrate-binding protein
MRIFSWRHVLSTFALAAGLYGGAAAAADAVRIGLRQFPAERGNPSSGLFGPPVGIVLQAIYDGLTRLDAKGDPEPALAVAWTAESPTTWVFTLRDGVAFSNGEQCDAAAVVAAIAHLLSAEGRTSAVGSALARWKVTGAVARDPRTVAVTTAVPDPLLPQEIYAVRIPAPAAFARMDRAAFAANPVGTGPFAVTRWTDGRIDVKANATSWRRPKVDGLTFIAMLDQSARIQGLSSGAIDIALEVGPEERETIAAAGGTVVSYLKPEMEFVAFITVKDSPLKDVRVRRALNYAVDKERMIASLLGGATVPASQIAHPQAFGYDPSLRPYPYDPVRARALLKEAGAERGFAMPTLAVGGANNLDAVFQQIASDLAAVGVAMEIRKTIVSKYVEYMYQGGWPGLAFMMTFSGFDALQGYRIRSCEWSHPYFCDPEMTPLIAAAQAATTIAERRRLTQRAVAHERDNPSGILLWQAPSFDGVAARTTGYGVVGNDVTFSEISLRH